jgi:HPt (histidine-containing phosphotransfer) domain-containing protein
MPRFLNSVEFYCRLLSTVPSDKAFIRLGENLKKKDAKAAFEDAHELKGVLANMGLSPMYEVTCRIVEPLRAGRYEGLDADYATLMEELAKLEAIIKGE